MRMIVIEESTFDAIVEEVCRKLELDKLREEFASCARSSAQADAWKSDALEALYRRFNYEVRTMAERLKVAR